MSFSAAPGRRVRAEINVTPLIDVVLVLLIAFMVAVPSPLRQVPLAIAAPEPGPPPPAPPSAPVAVRVLADARVLLDGAPVAIGDLGERVRDALRRDPRGVVLFDAEDDASYGLLMRALDSCRGAGARVLGVTVGPAAGLAGPA